MADGESIRQIGVLFSGGDAPGMNSFLRALVRLAINRYGAEVIGIKDGFRGLLRCAERMQRGTSITKRIERYPGRRGLWRTDQDAVRLDNASVRGLCGRGGILLGAGRCPEFKDLLTRKPVIEVLEVLGIQALVVVGGNGSLAAARQLACESDRPVIAVPATIDNDVPGTVTALGVDAAVNTLMQAVERLNDTASSHHRIMVLETMGGASGELARLAAIASGAEIVVVPERGPLTEKKMAGIAERLQTVMHHGRQHAIVLIVEGVACGESQEAAASEILADYLGNAFRQSANHRAETEVRVNVLGYLQRGGSPTAADRILAVQFAEAAWRAPDRRPAAQRPVVP